MVTTPARQPPLKDYSLTGKETAAAIERGLAEASWYCPPVPKEKLHALLQRRDLPAIRDTILWFALIIGSGWAAYRLWSVGSSWAVAPFLIYGVLYASSSDSRWHETSHGTAFKTDWLNDALYEIASFMLMREATVWRWSHTRHHSDTNIVGRDPEIAVPRTPGILGLLLNEFFGIKTIPKYFWNLMLHCSGRLTAEQKTFIPESEYKKVFIRAPIYLLIYASVIGLAIYHRSILPLLFVGLPTLYGSWLLPIYASTQHAGLAEDVLDHRLNTRTIYMNRVNRYLYWNMNFHLEHHLFPLVPYHNLAKLHEIVKPDTPVPYSGLRSAWSEVIPAVLRQAKDPSYCIKRELPPMRTSAGSQAAPHIFAAKGKPVNGWLEVGVSALLKSEEVIRFDHQQHTYAIYRSSDAALFATDGICTHGNTHLADGLVKGRLVECPKHNGRFDIADGSAQRAPACVALKTYKVREHDGKIFIDLQSVGAGALAHSPTTYKLRVVSNENVATFIKELVLEAEEGSLPDYQPGDYLQFDIPAYGDISLNELTINRPFIEDWRAHGVFDFRSENAMPIRRNYSFATNPAVDHQLRFNIRIATPPHGQTCLAGAGSAYVHRLKPGDTITAIGPFGSFHVKPGSAEMVYVGGGAGMAPLRSHLSHLFETLKTERRVGFWYGARSRKEVFYQDYFESLERRFPNFSFHVALSEPRPDDAWPGHVGLIHEVLRERYLMNHANLEAVEYYLCGPPLMIKATTRMLHGIGVDQSRISFDEF
jgi:Na+-transporting NADH:ubiquinone oxidoreductase subunit F